MKKILPTEPYKGVRDFFPQDYFLRRFIEDTMSQACESFGYERYDASILEHSEIYKTKASDEIANEQTYSFIDRGGREVTLRPEMTPTVARMVSSRRRELPFPLRWYSIPNVFRYERPQRGRLREHWQLNADIFGVSSIEAETEIIALSHRIMTSFGAKESEFEIRLNDRRIFEHIFTESAILTEEKRMIMRILDKRAKIDKEEFNDEITKICGKERAEKFLKLLSVASTNPELTNLIENLAQLGIRNVVHDISIARGFDYYTGVVFEVFDVSPENNRSLFGGGRYDNLLSIFGAEPVATVGFGMGDVTIQNFLEIRGLLPKYVPATELMICVLEDSVSLHAKKLANELRSRDVTVAINFGKKIGDQIKTANKLGIPFIIPVGQKEVSNELYNLKNLTNGNEIIIKAEDIANKMMTAMG